MTGLIVNPFAGPGGWESGMRMLGLGPVLGIELDRSACATNAAAGGTVVQGDVTAFPVERLGGKMTGFTGSPECTQFSAAGNGAGNALTEILAEAIRDVFAGRKTRAARRRKMARVLRRAADPKSRTSRSASYSRMTRLFRVISVGGTGEAEIVRKRWTQTFSSPAPADLIWKAVRSASLVLEPARFIAAGLPEWVALEQVPSVLPLWKVYAEELRKLGYQVWTGTLNSADYGVPQTRIRAILIASRVRIVRRPEPTHYDPRKGMQLWGTPWVSMADALGWGGTVRPAPTCTAGGVSCGGYEPFAKGGREALTREQEAGRWILHTNRDQRPDGSRQTADPRSAPAPAPAPALTAKSGGQWVLRSGNQPHAAQRPAPAPAPAPTIAFGHNAARMTWKFRNNNNNNACERSLDEPAGTLFFGGRSNWAAWTRERPATTVQGDPRIGRPEHKDRSNGGEFQFVQDSVRITVQEAAILQSFRADYPWQGTRTAQFSQVGNAWCPRAAAAVIGEATGLDWQSAVAREYGESEAAA